MRDNQARAPSPEAAPADPLAPPSAERAEPLPRQFGKYMLMRKLAAGGMAELFLALHRSVAGFEKLVVIKRILPQMNNDKQFIDMLLHEARIAATLSHPNIVQTFDVGQVDGTYFIAMEHIHGEDIRTIVRQMKKKEVAEFPLEHALSVVIGLCAGLAYAHEKRDLEGKLLGIVHRDISPQNIVLTFSGDVKVVDFGVAKSLHATEESHGGQLKGKVPYMSPEQAAGEDIDWRSDIFAAGVILFELTTGKRLFKGSSEYDTLKLICETDYPMPGDVVPGYPSELERIVMRALAKSREARYQSARELQADLEAFVRHERLAVSAVTLSKWMQSLFAEKLDEQKADLHDIKLLADRISADMPLEYAPASTGSHPSARFDQSTTAAGAPAAAHSIPPAKKSRSGLFAGVAVVIAVVAAGGIYVATRGPESKAAPNAAETSKSTTSPAATTAATEAKGKLVLESDPPGAAIWIDGELFERPTPTTIDSLPVGRDISLKLSKEGFASYRETFKLAAAGDTKTVKAKLGVGGVTVALEVVPTPTIWVDKQLWTESTSSVTGLAADEEHTIVVTAPGYQPKTFTFTAKQGETKTFKHALVKMTPEQLAALDKTKPTTSAPTAPPPTSATTTAPPVSGTGTLRVNSKGGFCAVTVNGAPVGMTPVSTSVPAGNVRVSCKPESGPAKAAAVEVKPGETKRISFDL
ncbi:MAG: serine/threonine-protein kinase [Polyangiaceae bacterium]